MNAQRGNILFLILLAVVLFAALAYAVTSSMRGGGKDSSSENAQSAVSDISTFLTGLESATQRMMMTGGVKAENISFEYQRKHYDDTFGGGYGNATCAAESCRMFKPNGGGMEARTFEKYALTNPPSYGATSTKPGYYDFWLLQYPYAGTSANDIVVAIRAIRPEICVEYNKRLGITAVPTVAGGSVAAHVPGVWDDPAQTISNNAAELMGKNSFATGTGAGYCNIFQLLIAR